MWKRSSVPSIMVIQINPLSASNGIQLLTTASMEILISSTYMTIRFSDIEKGVSRFTALIIMLAVIPNGAAFASAVLRNLPLICSVLLSMIVRKDGYASMPASSPIVRPDFLFTGISACHPADFLPF